MKLSRRALKIIVVGALVLFLGAYLFQLSIENQELAARPALQPVIYQQIQASDTFLNGASNGAQQESFTKERERLIKNGERFITVDLDVMQIKLYEGETISDTVPVLSKGRDGSWWETPTGSYSVLAKEANHFSSIGKVWMPWSIQFYGNFFVHGWPYYDDGTPVSKEYSGGCIRLSSDDAKRVYEFVNRNTPILIVDKEDKPALYRALVSSGDIGAPPTLSARAALVAELEGGEVLLNKDADIALPIASLTKLMTSVVASELIYLERSVTIKSNMLTASVQSFPLKVGDRYRAFDLLYPLLESSSNGSASALASLLGENYFVSEMNRKAVALGMKDSSFVDVSGIGEGNVSTARDLARFAQYILDKRHFLFEISKGELFNGFAAAPPEGLKPTNEFISEPALIGMKNGETRAANQTMLSVWSVEGDSGDMRAIVIVVLGSDDRAGDTRTLLNWLTATFEVQLSKAK